MTNEMRKALKAPGGGAFAPDGPSARGPPRLAYSVAEACYLLNSGKTKLYELIAAGRLDARALDGKTLITAESLERLVTTLPPAPIGQKQQAT
jgi:excisionase family DNA binding protein